MKTAKLTPNPKTTSKREPRKSYFRDEAMVYDGPTLPVTMDTTGAGEISIMLNEKFSKELFDDADMVFNIGKLDKYKQRKNPNLYLKEGKKQIQELWRTMESFATHANLFRTSFLIAIGRVLKHMEDSFSIKSDYTTWLRENFKHKHQRYFQHAKQLAKMGAFARNYACLGKNRLLELERTRKEMDTSFHNLLTQFPFQDITEDHGGTLFKEHVDAIITYHRLYNAGITCVVFDQAALISAQLNGSITIKMVNIISNWIAEKDDKPQALDDLILNKLAFPDVENARGSRRTSIRKHLADLVNYSDSIDYENDNWVSAIRDQIDERDLKNAYQFISTIAEKLGIDLSESDDERQQRRVA